MLAGVVALGVTVGWAGATSEVAVQKRDSNQARDAVIEEALALSGFGATVDQISAMLTSHAVEMAVSDSEPILDQSLAESVNGEVLYRSALNHVRSRYDSQCFLGVIEWLQSPLGQKMSSFRVQANGEQMSEELAAFAFRLQAEPPSEERRRLIRRLDEVTHSTAMNLELSKRLQLGTLQFVNRFAPAEERLSESDISKLVSYIEEQERPLARGMVRTSFLYTYRSASDEEMARYIEHLRTRESRCFRRILFDSLLKTTEEAQKVLYAKLESVLAAQARVGLGA